MKKLFTKLPLAFLTIAFLTAGCGKENTSGALPVDPLNNSIGTDGFATAAQNYANVQEVRNAFNQKSFADGLPQGKNIRHVGSYFGGTSGSSTFSGSVSACVDLFGWQPLGDCQEKTYEQELNQMLSYIEAGRILKVQSAGSSSASFQEVNGYNITNGRGEYTYANQLFVFDRSSLKYQDMLGFGENAQVLKASVNIAGENVPAIAVRETDGRVTVLSTNLPIAANPILVGNLTWSGLQVKGYLDQLGDKMIMKISIPQIMYEMRRY